MDHWNFVYWNSSTTTLFSNCIVNYIQICVPKTKSIRLMKHFSIYLQLLQNLGKVDRTADEIFDDHLTNFNRQQNNAARLQKEFNNYIRCVRGKAAFQNRKKKIIHIFAYYILIWIEEEWRFRNEPFSVSLQRFRQLLNRWRKPYLMFMKHNGPVLKH